MRHNNKINHLGRTYSHRAALLSNMAVSLIKHKRIFTTLAKAKELRKYVEPIISKSKNDSTHSRRLVFQELHDKYAVTVLFQEISQKIGDRPGGYTRIIKTGNRLGDNASTCFIELVDYNELMLKETTTKATKTRRSRRSSGKGAGAETPVAAAAPKAPKAPKAVKEEAPVVEEVVVEELPVVEEVIVETPAEETPKAE
ncbi:MAG: 50S ribosomal protein L17 [Candidatus Symbiothrix sp.]|jgi:large subunit ribosomal protein L17|nr:50S ribosomal protein L17 [Candidatus Symbiothrix sp.]